MDPKQKKFLYIGGIVLVVVLYLYLKGKGSAAPTSLVGGGYPAQAAAPDQSTGFADVIHAINTSNQALAATAANQIVSLASNFSALGAESWLSCLPAGGARPDAMCIKAKGGVIAAGGQNVSNVKTQHILDTVYVGPYASCKKADQSYDLTCVGNLIAGNPPIHTVTVT